MGKIDTEILKLFVTLTEAEKLDIINALIKSASAEKNKQETADRITTAQEKIREYVYVWDKSPVMKMVGRNTQSMFLAHPEVEEVFYVFRDMPELQGGILPAIMGDNIVIDLLYSMYTLGQIHGQRMERKRRAERRAVQ